MCADARSGDGRSVRWVLGLAGLAAAFLCGCSSAGRTTGPSRGAECHAKASEAIKQAEEAESAGNLYGALTYYRAAQESVNEGRKHATPVERAMLDPVQDKVMRNLARLEYKQKEVADRAREAQAVKEKQAAALLKEDPLELMRKQEEEARKERERAKVELEGISKLALPKAQPKGTDVDTDTAATTAPEPGAKTPTAGKSSQSSTVRPSPAQYPVSVEKIVVRGSAALAYFGVFNKDQTNNKRIARVFVTFRNAQNKDLSEADAVFEAGQFDPNAKDLLEQSNPKAMLTGESHEVFANTVLKLVAVATGQCSTAKKAQVRILFADQSELTGTGPAEATGGGAMPPGL